ncbi:MAG: VOC family protein [Planctomycetota bacterium]
MPAITIRAVKFMLMAQDMPRAVAFYRDVLGLTLSFESEHWSELTFGNAIVALHGGGTGATTRTGLSIQVTQLDAACQRVAAGGGSIVEPPQSRPGEPIRLAIVADPEGNEFYLTELISS